MAKKPTGGAKPVSRPTQYNGKKVTKPTQYNGKKVK